MYFSAGMPLLPSTTANIKARFHAVGCFNLPMITDHCVPLHSSTVAGSLVLHRMFPLLFLLTLQKDYCERKLTIPHSAPHKFRLLMSQFSDTFPWHSPQTTKICITGMEIFIFVEWCMKNTRIDLNECACNSNGVKNI